MTRILLTAATLIGLTTAAFAQGYDYDPPRASYYQQLPMSYGNPYDRPQPSTGN